MHFVRILLLFVGLALAGPGKAEEPAYPALPSLPDAPASVDKAPAPDLHPEASVARGLTIRSPGVLEVPDHLPRVPTVDLTYDAADIWDRIRRGFGMPDLYTDEVNDQQVFYLSKPGFLKRVFERGRPYLFHIVEELEARGMPTELALLPMVESAYNPMAHSPAQAAGLWQFIPSTGRNFNLEQNAWVDERRDVLASTSAALDYLQQIYDMHGDWHLALASYNWGEGAVARAVARNREAGLPTEYAYLRMPAETRNYVPKLQALKNIVAQPELFGLELPHVANRMHFTTVESPAGMDVAVAARLAEMPLDEFVALNPSFKKPVIAGRSQPLVIPVDKVETYRSNLALAGNDALRWRTHVVDAGETLPAIAGRHRLPLGTLAEVNGLSPSAQIRPGQSLLIPAGSDIESGLKRAQARADGDARPRLVTRTEVIRDKKGRRVVVTRSVPAAEASSAVPPRAPKAPTARRAASAKAKPVPKAGSRSARPPVKAAPAKIAPAKAKPKSSRNAG